MSKPELTVELAITLDHGQVYLYGTPPWELPDATDDDYDAPTRALEDAERSRRRVGVHRGLVDLLVPVQFHQDAPTEVEVWASQPPDDLAGWDHVVDVDLDLPDGRLLFEAPEAAEPHTWADVPHGRYRARLAGRGYAEATADGAVQGGADSYRVQLWPRTIDSPPELVKAWDGWPD